MSLEAASSLAAFAGRLQLASDRFLVSALDSAQYNHVGSLGAISAVGCATLGHRDAVSLVTVAAAGLVRADLVLVTQTVGQKFIRLVFFFARGALLVLCSIRELTVHN